MTQFRRTFVKRYAPRGCLTVAVRDLTAAPTDGIVSPSNGGLAPGGGLAEQVLREAGPELVADCERIIESQGRIETTRALLTGAGRLPYRGILHAVGPRMIDEGFVDGLAATFLHCLELAEGAPWRFLRSAPESSVCHAETVPRHSIGRSHGTLPGLRRWTKSGFASPLMHSTNLRRCCACPTRNPRRRMPRL